MNKPSAIAAVVVLTAVSAFADLKGAWTASSETAGSIHLNLTRRHSNNGQTMELSSLSGLTEAQVNAAAQTPVRFEIAREAGRITFDGTFRNGDGAGQFVFTPNRGYLDSIRAMGISIGDIDDDDDPESDLMQLTLQDVSTAYIKSMQAAGYRVALDKYLAMRIFRITPELVRELADLGYRNIDADELIATSIHRVTPAYIREMRAGGFKPLSLDDLVSTRIHGATPQFAREMAALGYRDMAIDDLVSFRIHRVTPEFIRELRDLGYSNVPADDLVAMRIHRVTPDFIRELKAAGYENVPIEKLVAMRIHGIDARMIEKMNKQ